MKAIFCLYKIAFSHFSVYYTGDLVGTKQAAKIINVKKRGG